MVRSGSNASVVRRTAGDRRLVPGMVIVDVNREPVTDLASAKALLKRGERHLLLVYFRGAYRYLPVDLP